jgi:hypothetical protein
MLSVDDQIERIENDGFDYRLAEKLMPTIDMLAEKLASKPFLEYVTNRTQKCVASELLEISMELHKKEPKYSSKKKIMENLIFLHENVFAYMAAEDKDFSKSISELLKLKSQLDNINIYSEKEVRRGITTSINERLALYRRVYRINEGYRKNNESFKKYNFHNFAK